MNPGYKSLLIQLVTQHQGAETGVVHFFTDKNEYGRIALTAGQIKHLSLHTQRGMAALPLLLKSTIRSQRFEVGTALPPTEGLPNTQTLLTALGVDEPLLAATPSTAATVAVAATKPADCRVSPDALFAIQAELEHDLGAMAASLVKQYSVKASDALSLAQLLAEQLTPDEGARFFERIRTRLTP